MAFGTLVIKQRLKCSDKWVIKHISLSNGYIRSEQLDFESYDEVEDLYRAVE